VMVALPGQEGTASAVDLAVRYGVPVCRFVGLSGDIAGLSKAAAARSPAFVDFPAVQEFVRQALMTGQKKAPTASLKSRRKASVGGGLDAIGSQSRETTVFFDPHLEPNRAGHN
ncbi:unnamed protein product, partial [Polarella glacialis]